MCLEDQQPPAGESLLRDSTQLTAVCGRHNLLRARHVSEHALSIAAQSQAMSRLQQQLALRGGWPADYLQDVSRPQRCVLVDHRHTAAQRCHERTSKQLYCRLLRLEEGGSWYRVVVCLCRHPFEDRGMGDWAICCTHRQSTLINAGTASILLLNQQAKQKPSPGLGITRTNSRQIDCKPARTSTNSSVDADIGHVRPPERTQRRCATVPAEGALTLW